MAADVVDAATHGLGRAVAPSLTKHLPIHGAVGYQELWADRMAIAAQAGLPLSTMEHLLGRYGSGVTDLLAMIDRNPALAAPLDAAGGYLAVEAVYAATHEGALNLDDILARRTRIAIEYPDRGVAAAEQVAELIAPHLGWDPAAREAALADYQALALAEVAAVPVG
jgi:glycerol-3-phosphate dehydrogenase